MTTQLFETLGWDEPTQAILRTLSRGDLSILQAAVAHSRGELEKQEVETENGYHKLDEMNFMTSEGTPIFAIYAHFAVRGWMKPTPVDADLLERLPTIQKYGLTGKGCRLLGQLLAYFVANNPLPPAPEKMTR